MHLKGFIIYDREGAARNGAFIRFLTEALERRHIFVQLLLFEEITPEMCEENRPDFAVVRTMHPELSSRLEKAGIRVFNPTEVSRICNHKGRTYRFMDEAGIPIPKTWYSIEEWETRPGTFPVVVKPAMGHGGIGVTKAENDCELRETVGCMADFPGGDYVIQSMVSDAGKDVRVYVMGDDIIGCMLRSSEKDFRSNFCLGGKASVYSLSEEEYALVERIRTLLPFDYVGIDFMFHEGKAVFNEIEDVVGARMLYQEGINVAELYAEYIERCMTEADK